MLIFNFQLMKVTAAIYLKQKFVLGFNTSRSGLDFMFYSDSAMFSSTSNNVTC